MKGNDWVVSPVSLQDLRSNRNGAKAMTETRPVSENAPNPSANQNPISGSSAAHLALVPTWLPPDVTGSANYNSAGSGGDGVTMGVISSNPMAVFMPSNAAIAGPKRRTRIKAITP